MEKKELILCRECKLAPQKKQERRFVNCERCGRQILTRNKVCKGCATDFDRCERCGAEIQEELEPMLAIIPLTPDQRKTLYVLGELIGGETEAEILWNAVLQCQRREPSTEMGKPARFGTNGKASNNGGNPKKTSSRNIRKWP